MKTCLNKSIILSIDSLFKSIDTWEYRSRVVDILEWPSISLTVLAGISFSNALITKVCRRQWKFA
jgi:hypothetical protein